MKNIKFLIIAVILFIISIVGAMASVTTYVDDFNRADNQDISTGEPAWIHWMDEPLVETPPASYVAEGFVYIKDNELFVDKNSGNLYGLVTAVGDFNDTPLVTYGDGNITLRMSANDTGSINRWGRQIYFGEDLNEVNSGVYAGSYPSWAPVGQGFTPSGGRVFGRFNWEPTLGNRIYDYCNGVSNYFTVSTVSNWHDSSWHDYTFQFDLSGTGSYKVYVDGVFQVERTNCIGAYDWVGNATKIDSLAISMAPNSDGSSVIHIKTSEVTLNIVTSESFDLTTDLLYYYPLDDETEVVNAEDVINSGATFVTGKVGDAVYCAQGDYLYNNMPLPTGDFTYSYWLNAHSTPTNHFATVSRVSAGTLPNPIDFHIYNNPTPDKFQFYMGDGSLFAGDVLYDYNLNYNNWELWTYTWNGTTQTIYKDGVEVSSGDQIGQSVGDNIGRDFRICQRQDVVVTTNGTIDELAIWNRSLSASEVSTYYNSGNGSFWNGTGIEAYSPSPPPPAMSFADQYDMMGWWKLDESSGSAIDSHDSLDSTTTTFTQNSYTGKINTARGIGYANLGDIDTILGDTFSVAGWIYPYSFPPTNSAGFFSKFGAGSDYSYLCGAGQGNTIYMNLKNQAGTLISVSTAGGLANNQWYHVVCLYDGSYAKLYVNGVLIGQNAITGNIYNGNVQTTIGRTERHSIFQGLTDEVSLYNGVLDDDSCGVGQTCGGAIAILYNGGAGVSYEDLPSTTPLLTLTTDPVGTILTQNLDINYSGVLQNTVNDTFDCDLDIDGSLNQTSLGVNITEINSFSLMFGEVEEAHTYEIFCSNNELNDTTGVIGFTVDTLQPRILINSPADFMEYVKVIGVPDIDVDVDFENVNLQETNVSIINSSNEVIYNVYDDLVGLNLTEFSVNFSIDVSTLSPDTYTLEFYAKDLALERTKTQTFYVTACPEDWQPQFTSCDINDTQILIYFDNTTCGTTINLPIDNGSVSACNYCTSTYEETSLACVTGQTSRDITYDYTNSCCLDTGLPSDCNIPANTTSSCIGLHQTEDVGNVAIDTLVEIGVEGVKYAPLVAIGTIAMYLLFLI